MQWHKIIGAGGVGGADSFWITTNDNSTNTSIGEAIAPDGSGGAFFTGWGIGGAGGNEGVVQHLNDLGVVQWSKFLGTSGTDNLYGCTVDPSGNMIAVGRGYISSDYKIVVHKLNSSGTLQWSNTINLTGVETGQNVVTDASGNIYIACEINDYRGGLVKLNSSGTVQWARQLFFELQDYGKGIAIDSVGDIIIGGYSRRNDGSYDQYVAKYNASGTLQWNRLYEDAGFGWDVSVDGSDNIYLAGYSTISEGTLIKWNSSGTLQWAKKLTGGSTTRFYGCAATASGDVFVTGYDTPEAIIAKYNSSGVLQWANKMGTTNGSRFNRCAVDSKGNPYVTGYIEGTTGEFFAAKLPPDGSGTGTYGGDTYSSFSPTEGSLSGIDSASSQSSTTVTATGATFSVTETATSFTESNYEVII